MKILYLATVRLPTEKAHGYQLMKTCEALAEAGADVELLIPKRVSILGDDPFQYYSVKKNFTLTMLGSPDWVRAGWIGFILTAVFFAEVAKWQKAFWKADVIYSRDSLVLLQYVLLGRKLVLELHRKPTSTDTIVARVAHQVFAINNAIKNELVKKGVSESKISVLHDGVDALVVTKTRAALGMPEGVLIAYAGSQQQGKGVETLKEAEPHISGKVLFIQNKTPIEAREMLGLVDAVVVPNSATDERWSTYTSPMKLFEALASGAAVIASDVPAIREVVDESSVWFFKPDDPTDLARIINAALIDVDRSSKIASGQRIAGQYSWHNRAQTILKALSVAY